MAYAIHLMFSVVPVSCISSLALANTMSVIKYLQSCRERTSTGCQSFQQMKWGLAERTFFLYVNHQRCLPLWPQWLGQLMKMNCTSKILLSLMRSRKKIDVKELFQRDSSKSHHCSLPISVTFDKAWAKEGSHI